MTALSNKAAKALLCAAVIVGLASSCIVQDKVGQGHYHKVTVDSQPSGQGVLYVLSAATWDRLTDGGAEPTDEEIKSAAVLLEAGGRGQKSNSYNVKVTDLVVPERDLVFVVVDGDRRGFLKRKLTEDGVSLTVPVGG